ncbi:MAG: Gfo/Idh/MocA family protein [Acidobacteriota bacterium]
MSTPDRRTFVKAAAAAVATARFPILGANDRINVGIVGVGGRGRDHVNAYNSLDPDCRISAICDVNQAARERATAMVRKAKGYDPKDYADMRRMFESKDVDAVSIATPNHWHALSTIWACQAGKDVYVEKPVSHNIFEGAQMVKAARKYNRIVQSGTQSRSIPVFMRAMKALESGAIGPVYHARGLCFRRRLSIGHTPDEPVPAGIDWDLFLGPAQLKPYSKNKFAYNWHWFWDTGNGDIGNQGAHQMDICLWGLPRAGWPVSAASTGGKYLWKDDQETPNTLQTSLLFGDAQITFDTRNLPTPTEALAPVRPNYTGNIFFGADGFMTLDNRGFEIYIGPKYEKTAEDHPKGKETEDAAHMKNFLDAVRARNYKLLNADIEVGARSAAFCHLANIAYRAGHQLEIDTATGRFKADPAANALLTRDYRKPYVVPAF